MQELLEHLLYTMIKLQASDAHFVLKNEKLRVDIKTAYGIQHLENDMYQASFFYYLKFIANLDLANQLSSQCGHFTYDFLNKPYSFRFSIIQNQELETGVLRILNNHEEILLKDLSSDSSQYESFLRWSETRSGMVILSGPTGSGKSTTLHAILKKIALEKKLQVVSLEDPIEIEDDSYLQLQINEKANFGYEQGIRQLLRHNPDVIMIGEVRDPNTAKMMLRCALSGHMVFTTIHAKSCFEAVKRLNEFGITNSELQHTLTALVAQRLYPLVNKKGKMCIYEILEKEELFNYLTNKKVSEKYKTIYQRIREAATAQIISEEICKYDLNDDPT